MTVDRIIADLASIVDQATWAFHAAYGKSGRGLDAPRGRALDPRDTGEDNVGRPGEIDLEIGDSRARLAYQAACRLVGVGVYAAPAELAAAARRADPDPVAMREVAYLLEKAVGGSGVHQPLPPEAAVLDSERCKACDWRRVGKKHGGRCTGCSKYFLKHGQDRPREINPIVAKRQRLARGEDFGAA